MRKAKFILSVLSCLFFLNSFTLSAKDAIPESLTPWVPWVLNGSEKLSCPFINNAEYSNKKNHICAWPSTLELDVKEHSAKFKQHWQVLTKSIIPLPGNKKNWPLWVTIDEKKAVVFNHKGKPAIELVEGSYLIKGQFEWPEIPESLAIPPQFAFVKMSINNQVIEFPKIEGNDLWLQEFEPSKESHDSVDLTVSRHVSDGAFIKLETFINLNVSGKMREVKLGKLLPAGFELIGIESDISSFIDGEGILNAKLKPGSWEIKVHAYAKPTLLSWKRPELSHFWPKDEIWVFKGHENLRLGRIEGAKMVDSSQADMPSSWYDLPSYLVNTHDVLKYEIQHRGKPVHLENQLSLNRTLWLSFDNSSFTFNDEIKGAMINDWRLSMNQPYLLESAEDQDGSVLITTTKKGERGIENRYPQVNVKARGVINAQQQLPVTGWDSDFERATLNLNLPPGNKLFAVFGADRVSNSWWKSWTIWASFIVLLSTLMASRTISFTAGIATAGMLLVIYQETGAPVVAIINLLIAIAIKKHQPFNRIKSIIKAYWVMSITFAVGSILLFSAMQVRTVVYPQLETRETASKYFREQSVMQRNVEKEMSRKRKESVSSMDLESYPIERISVNGSRLKNSDSIIERYQADALMQAGSGIPNWQWNSYRIEWQSPIAKDQIFDVVILSKATYRVVKLFGVFLTILWLYIVLKDAIRCAFTKFQPKAIATVLALFILVPSYSPNLEANDFPSKTLLSELKRRVTEAPLCAPDCAAINSLVVSTDVKSLMLEMSVHANADTALAIPKSEFWRPEKLTINQKQVGSLYKQNDWIYIPVVKGISKVTLLGQVAPVDAFQLEFKDKPKHVKILDTKEWEVVGSQGSSLSGSALEFLATIKKKKESERATTRHTTQPFVKVTRVLSIDQTWTIYTTVERIAPSSGSINVSIPTILNEKITSADILFENEKVEVTIPAGERVFTWQSTIERKDVLKLHANPTQALIEHWRVIVSPSWHVNFFGLPIILDEQDNDDYFTSSFYPYPGESLDLTVSRPAAVKGDILAIDSVKYTIDKGSRTSKLNLTFDYRSTRGGEHIIELPVNYQLKEVRANDKLINLQSEEGKLAIPVMPGSHNIKITMRSSVEEQPLFTAPKINLNAPVSNVTSSINLSNQRWILWADGPILGPAVLYWGELLAFIILALLISKVKFSPLNTLSWVVLGFGLSLSNWSILMVVAVWFAAISASKYRQKDMGRLSYNGSQVVLYLLSAVAIISLISVVPISLLSSPSMGIEGNYSYGTHLQWFSDKTTGLLPEVSVLSISTIFYKGIMLVWVIWLSFSFLGWIKWAWQALGKQGYWQGKSEIKQKSEQG